MENSHTTLATLFAVGTLVLATSSAHAQTEPRFYSLHPSAEDLEESSEAFAVGFGDAVAIDGRTAMVGMPDFAALGQPSVGRVAIFRIDPDGTAPRVGSFDLTDRLPEESLFGQGLALRDDTAVIGSSHALRIFHRDHDTWQQLLTLPTTSRRFVLSPTVFGYDDGLLAIAATDTSGGFSRGAVLVYRIGKNGSAHLKTVLSGRGSHAACFGSSLALERKTLVIGAPCGTGVAYVFGVQEWKLRARLVASDPQPDAQFGEAVAIHAGIIAVGAPLADPVQTREQFGSGAGYVFTRHGNTWGKAQKISPTEVRGAFGAAVGVGTDRVAFGAPNGTTGQFRDEAFVEVYRQENGQWMHDRTLTSAISYGHVMDFSRSRLIIGVNTGGIPIPAARADVVDFNPQPPEQ